MNPQIQLLVFHLDERRYGLRLFQVRRVVRAVDTTPLPRAPEAVLGVIDFQGTIIPVLNMRKRLGMTEREVGLNDQFVIAHSARRMVALVVDGVMGVLEYSPEKITATERVLSHVELVDGLLQLDDGLILVHDLDRFLSLDEEQALEQALTRRAGDER